MNESRAHQLSPCRTVVTSFNPRQRPTSAPDISPGGTTYYDEGDWVLCVESNPSYISCALSNGEIQIYDPRRLHNLHSYKHVHGDQGMTTDLVGAPPQQHTDHILVSSGTDGKVVVVDTRQATPSTSFSMPHAREEALSVSLGYDGNLAAVGSSKSKIHFYDLRQPLAPLGSYVNSHTDEVTRVRFQHNPQYTFSSSPAPAATGWLLTGSEDGLACIFDTTQPSEEAALKSVMNNQASIRNLGFFGPNLEGIYCMTGSETMMLWSWESAQCLANYSDIRGLLSVDYLVDANWDPSRKELAILAGCNNGDACLSTLSVTSTYAGRPPLTTSHHMAGGHRGVVRDWCAVSPGVLVTVGEDARLCEWNMAGRQSNAVSSISKVSTPQTMVRRDSGGAGSSSVEVMRRRNSGGGPMRRQRNKRSVTPY